MKTILHCDINNFYASVEEKLNPFLENKPVIVCGNPENRSGIVLAKSQKAKECGVKTAETIQTAMKKCPNAILVSPSHSTYDFYSEKFFYICFQFSPLVESFGIDECWIDITHLVNKKRTAYMIAKELSSEIKKELGLNVSIGISFNKVFAKLGSDYKKPNGITEITKDNFKSLIYPLPIENLLNIGRSLKKALHKYNIFTIGDLANTSEKTIVELFGKNGLQVYLNAKGLGDDKVINTSNSETYIQKSLGNGTTLSADIFTYSEASKVILNLSQYIAFRLKSKNYFAKGLRLTIKFSNLKIASKQMLVEYSFNSADIIHDLALEILSQLYDFETMTIGIKAITINVFNIQKKLVNQTLLIDNSKSLNNLSNKVFKIKKKHGYGSIMRGSDIDNDVNLKSNQSNINDETSLQIFNDDI